TDRLTRRPSSALVGESECSRSDAAGTAVSVAPDRRIRLDDAWARTAGVTGLVTWTGRSCRGNRRESSDARTVRSAAGMSGTDAAACAANSLTDGGYCTPFACTGCWPLRASDVRAKALAPPVRCSPPARQSLRAGERVAVGPEPVDDRLQSLRVG